MWWLSCNAVCAQEPTGGLRTTIGHEYEHAATWCLLPTTALVHCNVRSITQVALQLPSSAKPPEPDPLAWRPSVCVFGDAIKPGSSWWVGDLAASKRLSHTTHIRSSKLLTGWLPCELLNWGCPQLRVLAPTKHPKKYVCSKQPALTKLACL